MNAAVIMAGGSGERFWPVSTKLWPKQFLSLTSDSKALLQLANDRSAALFGQENVYLATLAHLSESSLKVCPEILPQNVFLEPEKRNTAGCLIWAVAQLIAKQGENWREFGMAVVTADHNIFPLTGFVKTCQSAMDIARETGGLCTIGIRPDRPETGFGYIELGDKFGDGYGVQRFREKPDHDTAVEFLASGQFLWNSGMFFWTLGGFEQQLREVSPEMADTLIRISEALSSGDEAAAAKEFGTLPSISIDYALMEKASKVYVVEAEFEWDDLGSWDALHRTLGVDETGSTIQGEARLLDSTGCIVSTTKQEVCLLGMEDVVVVVTDGHVMVCPKDRVQEVKRFLSS